MQPSESPFILFLRSITLLALLVGVPGIAICWNHLPKDFYRKAFGTQSAPKSEWQHFRKDSDKSAQPVSILAPESGHPSLPESLAFPIAQAEIASSVGSRTASAAAIQQVSWEPSTQNITLLEDRLEMLGAARCRLEQWGNRGELVRFSCTVTPPGSYFYEKYFQDIGADAETVMRKVISDIEKWKSTL